MASEAPSEATEEVRGAMAQWLAEQKRVEDYRHLEREVSALAPEAQRKELEGHTELLVPLGVLFE